MKYFFLVFFEIILSISSPVVTGTVDFVQIILNDLTQFAISFATLYIWDKSLKIFENSENLGIIKRISSFKNVDSTFTDYFENRTLVHSKISTPPKKVDHNVYENIILDWPGLMVQESYLKFRCDITLSKSFYSMRETV